MIKRWALLQLTLLISCSAMAAPAPSTQPTLPRPQPQRSAIVAQAISLLQTGQFLTFRVFLKKAYSKSITLGEWNALKIIVNANADKVGFDLIGIWNYRNPKGKSTFDKTLEYGDSLMLAGKFQEAFIEYQKMAAYLKKLRSYYEQVKPIPPKARINEISALYPFVLHSMARALYGGGRYDEALVVYGWIPISYSRFRQVLFEKMWAAFRSGKVEIALGAIASQRSAFFSRYLSPEAYLIQSYIYRKLCRMEDLSSLLTEMKAYEASLLKGGDSSEEWLGSDLEIRVLWNLSRAEVMDPPPFGITRAEIEAERNGIQEIIQRAFKQHKPKIVADLKTAVAYSHLAGVTVGSTVLKPIRRLASRKELLEQDLEIWPADGKEEWADEVGLHYFTGESLCSTERK